MCNIQARLEGLSKNKSVREISRETGISETAIRSYLKKGVIPSADKAARLAVYFDVDLEWFITGNESNRAYPVPAQPSGLAKSGDSFPTQPVRSCQQCESLRSDLEKEREWGREIMRENREINEENRRLLKENGDLRVKQAEAKVLCDHAEVNIHDSPKDDTSQCA